MDVLTLRNNIEAVIEEFIGTYTLPSGAIVPAIAVLASGQPLNDNRMVSGLEVIIKRSPTSGQARMTFDSVNRVNYWTVYLVQWKGGSYNIDEARRKLEEKFPGSNSILIGVIKNLECLEQAQVRILDDTERAQWSYTP